MALPDYTTQDAATYKANIDATASDHESKIVVINDATTKSLSTTGVIWTAPAGAFRFELAISKLKTSAASNVALDMRNGSGSAGAAQGTYSYINSASVCDAFALYSSSNATICYTEDNATEMSGIITGHLIDVANRIWAWSGNLCSETSGLKTWSCAGTSILSSSDLGSIRLNTILTPNFTGGTARARFWVEP